MDIDRLKKLTLAIIFLVVLFVVFSFNQDEKNFHQIKVSAGDTHNLSGYAWSDNIGWINFNCLDEDTCGAVNYGVNIGSNNDLSGYAWSDNIGWISFNTSDLVSCPKGTCKAKLVGGSLTGWAKALSAGVNGWDGWISLGTQPSGLITYGVTLGANSEFTGYAWGSDVVGWVDFNPVYGGVRKDVYNPPAITQFNVESVINGDTPNISWTSEFAYQCTGSWTAGNLCSTVETCASGTSVGGAVTSQTTYTITCEGTGGTISVSETPSSYYNLMFISGHPNNVDINFVVSGATTTKTKIGVIPWNGFGGNVTLSAQLSSATPTALPTGSSAGYSDQTLSSSEYAGGSELSIFIAEPIYGAHTVPITGSGAILSGLELTINAQGVNPAWQEI